MQGERLKKQNLIDRARLLPQFSAALSEQLKALEESIPGCEAEEEREHVRRLVDTAQVKEAQFLAEDTLSHPTEGASASSYHARKEHYAITKRIAFCANRISDAEFLRRFDALYATMNRYRETRSSVAFMEYFLLHPLDL